MVRLSFRPVMKEHPNSRPSGDTLKAQRIGDDEFMALDYQI